MMLAFALSLQASASATMVSPSDENSSQLEISQNAAFISSPSAQARPGGDSGEAVRATRGDGGAVSWHGYARAISLLFPLHLQPICNCFSLIFLKITGSCLARERTAVSVRFIHGSTCFLAFSFR